MSDGQQQKSLPLATFHDAYSECLQARRRWHEMNARFVDDAAREAAHADLQSAVMYYFEALEPYMSQQKGKVQNYWQRAPLWKVGPVTVPAPTCKACGVGFDADGELAPGDVCPACQDARLAEGEVYVEDKHGRIQYHWQQGLRTLLEWSGDTKKSREVVGKFKRREATQERPQRLKPEVLIRISRLLDEVASELNLLAEVKKYTPRTKVPQ